jgi:hypothetical protein
MKSVHIRNKATPLLACAVGCLFILAGCSSDDDAPIVDTSVVTDVTVSGTVLSFSGDAPLPGVSVEGVYTSPGDVDNPTATTDAAGAFSMTVKTNTPVYLHGTLTGYATINSEKGTVSASESGEDIEMPTETEAQDIINAAFPTALPQLANHAWLAVDVYDTNGVELAGKTISSTVTPDGFAYIDCTGAPSTTAATVACTDRDGVMYLAYFGSTTEATVTIDGINKIAPLNLGEVTVLDYELAAVVEEPPVEEPPVDGPTAFDLGKAYYDANCASCHSAGSYDTTGFAGNLANAIIPLDLSNITGMGSVADIDAATKANLEAFLSDPSIQ